MGIFGVVKFLKNFFAVLLLYEPRCEKTGLRGFRLGPTQTRLYSILYV